jgi:hypothetical protein
VWLNSAQSAISFQMMYRIINTKSIMFAIIIIIFIKNYNYTLTCTVKPAITATSEQWPPVNNGRFDSSTASLNLTFIRPLFQTATFFRSRGWPLYTGLTVLLDVLKKTIYCKCRCGVEQRTG